MEVKMSNLQVSTVPRIRDMALRTLLVSAAVIAGIMLVLGPSTWSAIADTFAAARPHAPDLDLIARAPMVVQIHLFTVLAAFVVATLQMAGPKGTTTHRILGWSLAALFITTAVDSLFIRNAHSGPFNPFQIFSVWTLIAIPLAVLSARRGNIVFHARMMTGFYVGSLLIAGALTFMPGRLLWRVFFG
jgi:uncharacterized membrane protein